MEMIFPIVISGLNKSRPNGNRSRPNGNESQKS